MTAAAEGEAAKEATAPETPISEPATTPKDKRRTSFFGAFSVKKEKKADTSDNEVTDGENKEHKAKSNKLGGLFRKPSKAVKLDKREVSAAEAETKAEKVEETKEAVAEAAPSEETATAVEEVPKPAEPIAAEETKNVNVATSTPVQAAA